MGKFLIKKLKEQLEKGLETAGDVIKDGAKRFFKDVKSTSFLKRLALGTAIGAGCLALVGIAVGLAPFNPLFTAVLIGGLAQIPIDIFRDGAIKSLKEQYASFKESPSNLFKKPNPKALLVVAGIAAICAAVVAVPAALGVGVVPLAKGLGLSVARRLAKPVVKIPVDLVKKKTIESYREHKAQKEGISLTSEEELIRSFSDMSSVERQFAFERLKEKFGSDFAAAHEADTGVPATQQRQLDIPFCPPKCR